jgi:predicted nucleic acid-binding protein
MKTNIVAVDTNVLIYLHDSSNSAKRTTAKNILADYPKISTQVISEYLNTTRRLLALSKEDLLFQTAELFKECEVIKVLQSTLYLASSILKNYHLQLFDSIIVAASIESSCDILYSEDMQHGLVLNGTLTIINPFL